MVRERDLQILGLVAACGVALASVVQADDLEERVERARELPFRRPVPTREITRDELREVQALNFKDSYGDGRGTERELRALGLLSPEVGFRETTLGNKAEGVLGFYIFKPLGSYADGRIYTIPENQQNSGASTKEVAAHELAHALSDQHHDLERMFDAIPKTPTGDRHADRQRALFSLEEGVATLVGRASDPNSPHVAAAHWRDLDYLKARTQFLYTEGADFAQHLHDEGGWELIDKAYQSPPTSTEQILHPERYLAEQQDKPTRVLVPNLAKALPGFRPVKANTLGEFGLSWIAGRDAASGWDGDRYVVVENPETGQAISSLYTTWDSNRDAAEFHGSLADSNRGQLAALETGDSLYVEHDGQGNVFTIGGATDEQLPVLREALLRTRKRAEADDHNVAGAPRERASAPIQIADLSGSGRTLIVKSAEGEERLITLRPATEAGRERIQAVLDHLAQSPEATRVGPDRYVLSGGSSLIEWKEGVFTMGVGTSLAAVEAVEARLSRLPAGAAPLTSTSPPANRGGLIQGLGAR